MRIVITAVLLAASVVATVLSLTTLPFYSHLQPTALVTWTAVLWVLFAAAVIALRRVPAKAAVVLILIGSIGIGGAAMSSPPNVSTDSARYAWDGIVQNAGISPYRYAATSPYLNSLRPEWLFPPDVQLTPGGAETCVGSRIQTSHEPGDGELVCTALNRGTAHTIYPPSSELVFAAVRFIVGPNAQYWPLQLLGLLMGLVITLLLLRALRARGLNPRWAALWAWSPLWATEGVTNSHIDTLGALFLLMATLAVSSGKPWRGGIALGVAIGAKLIPVIGAPALLRGRSWKIVVAAVVTFFVLYVPYIIASGIKVLGYLPKYLNEEGYNTGSRFALISFFIRGKPAIVIAVVLLVILAFLVWRKSNPADPWMGQVAMIGITLLIVSPSYAWYALLLVPMIAMTGRWEWLAIALAITLRELVPHVAVFRVSEAVAILVIVVVTLLRAGPGGVRRAALELRHPWRAPVRPLARIDEPDRLASES